MFDVGWLFGEGDHDAEGEQHHAGGEAVDVLPSEVGGETRGEECGEGGAAVPCGYGWRYGDGLVIESGA